MVKCFVMLLLCAANMACGNDSTAGVSPNNKLDPKPVSSQVSKPEDPMDFLANATDEGLPSMCTIMQEPGFKTCDLYVKNIHPTKTIVADFYWDGSPKPLSVKFTRISIPPNSVPVDLRVKAQFVEVKDMNVAFQKIQANFK